ncbi:uncharacterized protein L969DRAFT_101606 [Mixia osmundae IAM 14324]|uniref:Ribosomal RNA-processing protein 44 n=1 Tax=Mixia osmundae (strain CBS 9802 / IAM 14324 / JCM 22182 / KY 12970) TaxID=764103 RepID=G7DY39_MIXOS|nr:uncharacterized protein L969DRAFT_101606 [Mixia osmundae IAM 14324]KEI41401.1 hypothetical protein L969DRAFT_101606 [Mixia osmundae IAM 14324]GAA95499.1 hypothetical protein E5Q_02154 [Mixia osmundae IAM 14324]
MITILQKRPFEAVDAEDGTASSATGVQQTKRHFMRKTAKGRVIKVIREQYLRNDLPCGSLCCRDCGSLYVPDDVPRLNMTAQERAGRRAQDDVQGPVLSSQGRPPLQGSSASHYLVIDTNIALHQMDLLESSHFGQDIILLQTVIDETRHRSLPLYNRLRALIADEDRRVYTFWNEARNDTYAQKVDGETINDRNDRAIRQAVRWYSRHLAKQSRKGKSTPDIVLVSDDAGNRGKAQAEGITVYSTKTYVDAMPTEASTYLVDLVARVGHVSDPEDLISSTKPTSFFSEYLPLGELQSGVASGRYLQGHFNPNPYNYLEGSVMGGGLQKPILLVGREAMNRSTAGDLVVVQLLPSTQWKRAADQVVDRDAVAKDDDPEETTEEPDSTDAKEQKETAVSDQGQAQPTGRVVGILRRAWRSYVCHLDTSTLAPAALESLGTQSVFAVPTDRKIPRIRIRTRQISALVGQKFLVSIDSWEVSSRSPEGHFIRALGTVENKEAEIESLLLEWDVPYRPFSGSVLKCLPAEGDTWHVPPKQDGGPAWRGREDLRELNICSIDPPGCQDIDDALHARMLPNGNVEAGVHIADVSYFVHPDNPMDAEAASRGTTVYLVDKRIDMLPALLGTNLCSLRPYVERLAFSVIWELDSNANIVSTRFTKSVIASKAAFTYEAAQKHKDDQTQTDELAQNIRLLNKLAIALRGKRMAAGALNLASPEVKIHMESPESTGPVDVEQKQSYETNSLVEEFMLLANISVAARIQQQFPQTAVLRRHLPPPSDNFDVLTDVLTKRKGVTLDVSSSGRLASSLDECVDPSNPDFNTLVRIMATRCMLSAEYFCSGSVAANAFGHYGLATPIYTHFTSPIRRYADILVHRQLFAAISSTPLHSAMHSRDHVDGLMSNINKRHRSGQQAGRASVEFYVALALQGKEEASVEAGAGKIREDAYVIRAFKNGVAVFVSKLGLEGLVTFKREVKYDPDRYELSVPTNTGAVTIGVFDKVKVEITVEKDKNTRRGKVHMALVFPVDSRKI